MGRRVAIVGGGLAGITAALDCAAGGAEVSLLEVRPRLGGAAYSFERDGLRLDNGQHVFLRCCVAYRALLGRLGSERRVHIQPRLEIPVLKPGSAPVVLRRSSLPAPLHLTAALARYRHIPLSQRAGAARAALALARLQADGKQAEEQTLGAWLAAHGQSPATVGALWDLIALPTLNLPADEASLALGAFVFRTGLLSRADAGDIGFHDRPLGETIGEPALRALTGAQREMALSVDELRERYLPALAQLFPRARTARVERFVVTREHAATFRATPGAGALRAGSRTPVAGLYLAGAWTDTGWPAT